MSIYALRNETPTARKDYHCDACERLLEGGEPDFTRYTVGEWAHILKAKANGYKIKIGDKYMKQVNVHYGDIGTFRAIPEIHAICAKYEYYDFD